MAYIGKSPDGTGVRSRFYYTQTSGGGTSVSGSSDDGTTLAFSDGAYVDVFLNGVLLVAGTDYNTSTANTIAGLAALANGDVVEVVVYDIFAVADTVSALNGGTFTGNVVFSGTTTGLDLNGTELILDADADTSITADTDDQIDFKTGGSDRVTISSSGNVGIGTSSPAVEAHIQTSSGNPELRIESTGANYASMNLKNSSVSYSTQIRTDQSNAYTIRDETAGANRFLINTSGNTAIGTTHFGSKLNVGGNMRVNTTAAIGPGVLELQSTASGTGAIGMLNSAGTSGFFQLIMFANAGNSAIIGSIQKVNDASVQYNTTSDARLKENISDITGAITRVKQLAPKRYSWINENLDAADQDGFLAHEAQTVVPGAVSGTQDEVDDDGNAVHMQMDYSKLVPLLTGALKEAIAKIETLETKVAALEAGE